MQAVVDCNLNVIINYFGTLYMQAACRIASRSPLSGMVYSYMSHAEEGKAPQSKLTTSIQLLTVFGHHPVDYTQLLC